jgi:hypothetical protein
MNSGSLAPCFPRLGYGSPSAIRDIFQYYEAAQELDVLLAVHAAPTQRNWRRFL